MLCVSPSGEVEACLGIISLHTDCPHRPHACFMVVLISLWKLISYKLSFIFKLQASCSWWNVWIIYLGHFCFF